MSEKKNIDKVFKEKTLGFHKDPPPEIWENILMGIQPEKKSLLPVFWRVAAGIAILLAFGLGYKYISKSEELGDEYFSKSEVTDEIKEEEGDLVKEKNDEIITTIQKPDIPIHEENLNNNIASSQFPSYEIEEKVDQTVSGNEESFSWDKNNLDWTNTINNLPIQIIPSPGQKDVIPQRKYNIQASWEDLLSFEEFAENEPKERDFLIEGLLSPIYSYRDISSSSSSVTDYYNDFESGQISYSGGLKVGFVASDRLSIHTGLVYARIGYSIGGMATIALKSDAAFDQLASVENSAPQSFVISNSIGKVSNSEYSSSSIAAVTQSENAEASLDYLSSGALLSPNNRTVVSDQSFSQIFHIMEIPFHLKYKLIDRKIDFNILSGLSTNFLIGNSLFLNEGSGKTNIGQMESVNTINYAGDFGFGLEYDVNSKLQLLFEPQFKYYLNSINKDNLVSNRPYTIGFYTGLSYFF